MKQGESQKQRTVLLLVIIIAVLAVGYLLSGKYPVFDFDGNTNNLSAVVTVENTPMVNGALPLPRGFPQDIPIEDSEIVESSTTYYPAQNADQLSVSYRSTKTIWQKYAEYKDYMNQAGYSLTEGDSNAPVRTISGSKENISLSVIVSSVEGGTLVQLSYLLKSL